MVKKNNKICQNCNDTGYELESWSVVEGRHKWLFRWPCSKCSFHDCQSFSLEETKMFVGSTKEEKE